MKRKESCKTCRRLGEKLFLKGEKCLSPKCVLIKKNYPPGARGKRKKGSLTEYGANLQEAQKIRNWYGITKTQFKNYVEETLASHGKVKDLSEFLIQKLEKRLDNIVFRLGFASSRQGARQMVSHGHFLVNGRPVDIPSIELKVGDKISLKESAKKKTMFKNLSLTIKKYEVPAWLKLDKEKLEGELVREPTLQEIQLPAEVSSVFEFYSK